MQELDFAIKLKEEKIISDLTFFDVIKYISQGKKSISKPKEYILEKDHKVHRYLNKDTKRLIVTDILCKKKPTMKLYRKLAKKYGVSVSTIRTIGVKNNINIREKKEAFI